MNKGLYNFILKREKKALKCFSLLVPRLKLFQLRFTLILELLSLRT